MRNVVGTNVVWFNGQAEVWHMRRSNLALTVSRPLVEVFCSSLLLESSVVMTEEAAEAVHGTAVRLSVDFYSHPITADEATVRCALPWTLADVQDLLGA